MCLHLAKINQVLSTINANNVARVIFNDFILAYGVMKEIRTDCGTEYKNELCKLLNTVSVRHRHESVGSVIVKMSVFMQFAIILFRTILPKY